jgi:AbiJ N-terminal domain 4
MDDTPTFSQRRGYTPPEPEITIRHDAPDWLRGIIIRVAYAAKLNPSDLREILCDLLLESPDSGNWSEFPNIDNEVQGLLARAEWFQVYDFIELIAQRLQPRAFSKQLQDFTTKLNEAFRRKGVGWQLVGGKIEIRGEESFEKSVRTAIAVTAESGRSVAERELHEALQDLSKRPTPDITGAIQHGMAALECVARDVIGDQNATLGELIKRNPGLLPKPLDTGVEKIWGYASDQARHVREGKTLDIRDAELVVGLAGSIATYLVKKASS